MSIQVEHLSKVFGTQKAVNDISFTAAENGVIGFLGPNGAGKSTTMKMITGFMQPDQGVVIVNGINVNEHPTEAKKGLGYLPEGNPLYYDMYIREYLAFIAEAQKVDNARTRIDEVVDITGLRPEVRKKTGQLSKGYKQRVGLAAALIHDPKVLILDEPTSGLDPNQIIEIRQLIKNLGETKTVLFSSHILQEVESICSRIIIINKGTIVADDRLENLKLKSSSQAIVIVKFEEDPGIGVLQQLDHVSNVSSEGDAYYIQTDKPDIVKKEVLNLSLQKNIDIISLMTKSQSLEEVFRDVTSLDQ